MTVPAAGTAAQSAASVAIPRSASGPAVPLPVRIGAWLRSLRKDAIELLAGVGAIMWAIFEWLADKCIRLMGSPVGIPLAFSLAGFWFQSTTILSIGGLLWTTLFFLGFAIFTGVSKGFEGIRDGVRAWAESARDDSSIALPLRFGAWLLDLAQDWAWTLAGICVSCAVVAAEVHVGLVRTYAGAAFGADGGLSLWAAVVPPLAGIVRDRVKIPRFSFALVVVWTAVVGFGGSCFLLWTGTFGGAAALGAAWQIVEGPMRWLLSTTPGNDYATSLTAVLHDALGTAGFVFVCFVLPVSMILSLWWVIAEATRRGRALGGSSISLMATAGLPLLVLLHASFHEGWMGSLGFTMLTAAEAVTAFTGTLLHDAHLKLGREDHIGIWLLGVLVLGVVYAFTLLRDRRFGPFVAVFMALLMVFGTGGADRTLYHLSTLPAGTRAMYLHDEMNIRQRPDPESPVHASHPRGTRLMVGTEDARGWAIVYDEASERPSGFIYRRSDRLRPVAP